MRIFLFFLLTLTVGAVSAQQFSVSASKQNVLRAGWDNPLSVTVENRSSANIVLRTDVGKLTKSYDGYIFYSDTGDVANITVYEKRGGKEVKIGVARFYIRQPPDPIARVGAHGSGRIQVGVLRSQAGINADGDPHFEIGLPIVAYSFNLIRGTEFIYEDVKNDGKAFSSHIREAIGQTRPGDSIVFNKILARRHNGTLTILEPLTLSVY